MSSERPGWPMLPDETIVCVDCGGTAHLLSSWPNDDPPLPGDLLVYRCADCMDRWDVVMPEADPPGGPR